MSDRPVRIDFFSSFLLSSMCVCVCLCTCGERMAECEIVKQQKPVGRLCVVFSPTTTSEVPCGTLKSVLLFFFFFFFCCVCVCVSLCVSVFTFAFVFFANNRKKKKSCNLKVLGELFFSFSFFFFKKEKKERRCRLSTCVFFFFPHAVPFSDWIAPLRAHTHTQKKKNKRIRWLSRDTYSKQIKQNQYNKKNRWYIWKGWKVKQGKINDIVTRSRAFHPLLKTKKKEKKRRGQRQEGSTALKNRRSVLRCSLS